MGDHFNPLSLRKRSKSRDSAPQPLMTSSKSPSGYVYIPKGAAPYTHAQLHALKASTLTKDNRRYNARGRIDAKKKTVGGSTWSIASESQNGRQSNTLPLFRPNNDPSSVGVNPRGSQSVLRRSHSIPDFLNSSSSDNFLLVDSILSANKEQEFEPPDNVIIHKGEVIRIQVPAYDDFDFEEENDFDDDFMSESSSEGGDIYDEIMQAMAPFQHGLLVRNKFQSEPMLNQAGDRAFQPRPQVQQLHPQRNTPTPSVPDFETSSVLSQTSSAHRHGLPDRDSLPRMVVLAPGRQGFGFTICCREGGTYPYFENILDGSISQKGGLRAGDMILEINGENVFNASLKKCVSFMKNEEAVSFKVLAPNQTQRVGQRRAEQNRAEGHIRAEGQNRAVHSRAEKRRPGHQEQSRQPRRGSVAGSTTSRSVSGQSTPSGTLTSQRSSSSHMGLDSRSRTRIFSESALLSPTTVQASPGPLNTSHSNSNAKTDSGLSSPKSDRDHIYDELYDIDLPKAKPRPQHFAIETTQNKIQENIVKEIAHRKTAHRIIEQTKIKQNDSRNSLSSSDDSVNSGINRKSVSDKVMNGKTNSSMYTMSSQHSTESGYGTISSNTSAEGAEWLRDATRDRSATRDRKHTSAAISHRLCDGNNEMYGVHAYAAELPNCSNENTTISKSSKAYSTDLPSSPAVKTLPPTANGTTKKKQSAPPPVASKTKPIRSSSANSRPKEPVSSGCSTLLPKPTQKVNQTLQHTTNIENVVVKTSPTNNNRTESVASNADKKIISYRRSISEKPSDFENIYCNLDDIVGTDPAPKQENTANRFDFSDSALSVYSAQSDFLEEAQTLLKKYVNKTKNNIENGHIETSTIPPSVSTDQPKQVEPSKPSFNEAIRLAAETFSKRSGRAWTDIAPDAEGDREKSQPTGAIRVKKGNARAPISQLAEVFATANLSTQNHFREDDFSRKFSEDDFSRNNNDSQSKSAKLDVSPSSSKAPSAKSPAVTKEKAQRSAPSVMPKSKSTSSCPSTTTSAEPKSKSTAEPKKISAKTSVAGEKIPSIRKEGSSNQNANSAVLRKITKSNSKDVLAELRLSMTSLTIIDENPTSISPPPEFSCESNEVIKAANNSIPTSPVTTKNFKRSISSETADSFVSKASSNNSNRHSGSSISSQRSDSLVNKATVEEISSWTVEGASIWLREIKLGEYCNNFQAAQVNGEKLLHLDRQGLISLGMTSVEHRRNFEQALRKLTIQ